MIIIMHSFPDIEENLFFDNGGPHLHTHALLYYNILSDSMIILDHGNMCRYQSHDIIMHSLPDIDEIRFFDNGGPNLHTHKIICIFIRQHFLTMKTYA